MCALKDVCVCAGMQQSSCVRCDEQLCVHSQCNKSTHQVCVCVCWVLEGGAWGREEYLVQVWLLAHAQSWVA